MTKRSLLAVAAVLSMLFAVLPMTAAGAAPGDVIINEVDADQAGTDAAEFVELYVEGGGVASLDGMTLVFFNGSTDMSYEVFDLTGYSTSADGYFVLCANAATTANCDLDVAPDTNLIQNGADAVALIAGPYANNAPLPADMSVVLDAIAYDTNDADDAEILILLNSGEPQVNEGGGGDSTSDSNQRCANGTGGARNTSTYAQHAPTPGADNTCDSGGTTTTTSSTTTTSMAPPGPVADVIINEVDADTPGTDVAEFIELRAASGGVEDLTGLSIVLVNGSDDLVYDSFDLDGHSTGADGYFVLCGDAANVANCDLDVSPNSNLIQNGADAVVLVNGNASDYPNDAAQPASGVIVDAIVYDTNDSDDAGILGLINTGQPQVNEGGAGDKDNDSNQRCPDGSGGNRNTDTYEQWAPTPGEANLCETPVVPPAVVLISEIQGSGDATPLDGVTVEFEGVVTGDYQGYPGLGGFFIQEEDLQHDGDPLTSEGVFVFQGGTYDDVAAGDVVRVVGVAEEFFGQTQVSDVTSITIVGSDTVTPTAMSLPVANPSEFEAVEGMLVEFGQTLFVTEVYTLGQYGEVMLSSGGPLENPTNVVAPGAAAQALQAANDLNNIQLDDGVSWSNYDPTPYLGMGGTLRGGDSTDNLTGVLGYSFGAYEIQPVGPVTFDRVNDRPAGPPSVGGELTVASFNVLNYFSTIDTGAPICGPASDQGCRGADSVEEFGRQNTKIVNAIVKLDADVVGLMEIENHASDAAVIDLVDGLNAVAGAGTYDYIATGAVGSDVIKVAAIYKPASVTPVGPFAILDSSVDPTFNDDKSRPVVAQTFAENSTGELFTIAVNHFKSKGSDCDDLGDPDTGDGQGNCNVTRTLAATALVNWLAGDPTGSGDGDALIIGDLNSYAKEDPISAITGVGYTDLIETYRGVGRAQDAYSYVFSGQWGYLDHALANESMATQVTGAGFWHINADEPPALDYQAWNNPSNQTSDEFRSSDHDPVVIGVTLDGAMAEIKRAAALLADTHPSGDNRTDHFLGKAFDAIDQSLNDGYWDGDDTISSKKVFDDIAKAIREIGHASRYGVLDDATAQAAIDKLVGAARVVAAAALDAAAADPSDPVHLSRGADWLQQGDDAASEGEDAIAVLKYKQAWVEAGRAVS